MSLKPTCQCHDHSWDSSVFFDAALAVQSVTTGNSYWNHCERFYQPGGTKPERPNPHKWHVDLQVRFTLHPVVKAMLAHRPHNWQALLLEWPHISEKDSAQLAYTRDENKGTADVQTLTSIGKYVARHWPHVSDHVRRDACALFTPDKIMLLPATTAEIVRSIQEGPRSCMQGNFEVHPYKVYDPKMGWAAAVRTGTTGRIDGRALVWTDPDDENNKGFVRTYSRNMDSDGGYSHADQVLAAWLESNGFTHWSAWPEGTPLAFIENRGRVVLPYIDGGNDYTCRQGARLVICDEDDGEYRGENQSGYAEGVNGDDIIGSCEDCGTTIHEDDRYAHTGRREDRLTCPWCLDEYTYVEGPSSNGRYTMEYYVPDDQAVYVNGNNYDENNLPSNIVQLENGDYFDIECDDYCEIDGEYYLCYDDRVVYCEDSEYRLKDDCVQLEDGDWYEADHHAVVFCADEKYRLVDDCWCCDHSGDWYSNNDTDDQVEVDGEYYHRSALAEIIASKAGKTADEYLTELATA